jgi:ribosomal protein S18 acetylase RimI-like enzyme
MIQTLHHRKATLSDIPALVALVNGAYRGETGKSAWTSEAAFIGGQRTDENFLTELLKSDDKVVFLAVLKQKIVGCVEVELACKDQKVSYFGMLSVAVECQQNGIGDYLIRIAENFAITELRANCMKISVISIRKELIAYYERRGYVPTGERKSFPYGDERFGLPERPDLEFKIFSKELAKEKPDQCTVSPPSSGNTMPVM